MGAFRSPLSHFQASGPVGFRSERYYYLTATICTTVAAYIFPPNPLFSLSALFISELHPGISFPHSLSEPFNHIPRSLDSVLVYLKISYTAHALKAKSLSFCLQLVILFFDHLENVFLVF